MADDVFKPWGVGDREIYRFHDGVEVRAIDPLPVLRKLKNTPGLALETDLALAAASEAGGAFSAEGEAAIGRLVAAVRRAFNISDIKQAGDGSTIGMTEKECVALLLHFGQFIGGLAKAAVPFPSSPAPTAAPASDDSTTVNGSASG